MLELSSHIPSRLEIGSTFGRVGSVFQLAVIDHIGQLESHVEFELETALEVSADSFNDAVLSGKDRCGIRGAKPKPATDPGRSERNFRRSNECIVRVIRES